MVRTKKAAGKNNKMPAQQPPLPPGSPPRQSGYDSYSRNGDSYSGDTYRPSQGGGDNYQPRGAPPMYQFGAGGRGDGYNNYRPNYDYEPRRRSLSPPHRNRDTFSGSSYRPSHQNDRAMANGSAYRQNTGGHSSFDFRYDAPAGLDYNAAESRRRSPPRHNYDNNRRQATNAYRGGARGGYRGRGGPRLASEREFLKTNRAPTPELMPGMDEDVETGAKYKAVDDMSDSDEVEMDMSDDGDEDQEAKKKARTDAKAADGDSVPRWSNPDPYTALPPPDETRAKKKDVVKLIRKARVTSSSEHTTKPAAADDFISFDFGDDEEQADDDMAHGFNAPSPPKGPREIAGSVNDFDPPRGPAIQQMQQPRLPLPKKPEFTNQGRSNDTSFTIKQNGKAPAVSKKNAIDLTSDPALGSRKRDFRDEIKPAPILHQPSKGKPGRVSGQILKDWVARSDLPAAPWLGMDHSDSAGVGVWLHKEIMDFYEYVRPRDFEQVIRQRLIDDLQARLTQHFDRNCEVRPFGSFPAGLFLPTADMDLVCVSRDFLDRGKKVLGQGLRGLFRFRDFIQQQGLALNRQIELISGAKVPLVKYVDKLTGLKVDISFENDTGLIANNTFQVWKREFPAMPILVTLIKHLLAMRGLNEPVNGGIGGFSVTCLVVSLLQHLPQVQSRSMIPEHHLGEVLMEFLDLYGNEFNTTTTAISVNPPAYIRKDHANIPYKGIKSKFMIIDPNRSDNDIAGGSSNTEGIRRCFSDAFKQLSRRSAELQRSDDRSNKSLLECIIGGNYRSFELQRAHLEHVHEKLILQK
ncbi:hypothetical protein ONS95_011909 [Cadophora gregata]|uniref:uncharacterized protein n=1 Tax=Cadophora gregata TaxID=51156 RepID=UPI0026DD78F3|nr:uncharacterized protein ONS95_011909 [Cadophora gregata]KAK0117573.1 hypothetical protein ONS95_011909 [Cadophora gregata]KAK0122624.1 hypothetical protein ONS96_009664 [Cadophora gregata f. sp. sojae]